MAKKIVGFVKLQVPAGKANPSPPIGPALGQRGLNIMEFCKQFNAQTQGLEPGLPIPVVITAFADKSFTFVMKTPPATVLIKKAAKVEKGSKVPHTDKVGTITREQAEQIAKTKQPDLTASDLDAAVRTIAGSARRTARKAARGNNRTDTAPCAVIVASRGAPSSNASSPSAAGASTTASTASWPLAVRRETRSRPCSRMYSTSPGSPSLQRIWPLGY